MRKAKRLRRRFPNRVFGSERRVRFCRCACEVFGAAFRTGSSVLNDGSGSVVARCEVFGAAFRTGSSVLNDGSGSAVARCEVLGAAFRTGASVLNDGSGSVNRGANRVFGAGNQSLSSAGVGSSVFVEPAVSSPSTIHPRPGVQPRRRPRSRSRAARCAGPDDASSSPGVARRRAGWQGRAHRPAASWARRRTIALAAGFGRSGGSDMTGGAT